MDIYIKIIEDDHAIVFHDWSEALRFFEDHSNIVSHAIEDDGFLYRVSYAELEDRLQEHHDTIAAERRDNAALSSPEAMGRV